MKAQEMLRELESIAQKKSIEVTYENLTGDVGAGGLCKLKGQWRVLVDKRATDGDKAQVLAQALARFDLEDVFMPDQARALVEKWKKGLAAAKAV
jgi:hypothetical protein